MSSTADRLIYMANQIARNLATMGDDAAALTTANHIKQYWEPRMIAQIKGTDQSALSPIAARAIGLIHGTGPFHVRTAEPASIDGTGPCDAG